jgi:hypothetical protein
MGAIIQLGGVGRTAPIDGRLSENAPEIRTSACAIISPVIMFIATHHPITVLTARCASLPLKKIGLPLKLQLLTAS